MQKRVLNICFNQYLKVVFTLGKKKQIRQKKRKLAQ